MLNQSEIDTFQQEGAVVLRNVFTDWVPTLIEGVEKNLAQPSPLVRDYYDEKGGRFFGDYCSWDRIPEYRDFLFNSSAPDIAGQGIANPIGQIWAAAMMLEHLGATDASAAIVNAIEQVLADPALRTRDLGGTADTETCGAAIASRASRRKVGSSRETRFVASRAAVVATSSPRRSTRTSS